MKKSLFPSSIPLYYNKDLPDVTTFDSELAEYMLDQAGYTKALDGWRIDPETGEKLQELQIVTNAEESVGYRAFCERWVEELNKAGVPARMEYTSIEATFFWINRSIEPVADRPTSL